MKQDYCPNAFCYQRSIIDGTCKVFINPGICPIHKDYLDELCAAQNTIELAPKDLNRLKQAIYLLTMVDYKISDDNGELRPGGCMHKLINSFVEGQQDFV
jgi:hypothetical protein